MIYLKLCLSFLLIGTLAFGGGYSVLPLIEQQCVNLNHWLTMTEYSDLLTISQITPGPIAINSATFVGMKVAGIPGALVASFSFVLPPFLIVSGLFALYRRYGQLKPVQDIMSGLKPGLIGLIALAAVNMLIEALWGASAVTLQTADLFSAVLLLAAFVVLRRWKLGAIAVILTCGAIGVLWELLRPLTGF